MDAQRHRISRNPGPAWTAPEHAPDTCAGARHTGVVFVHGVGFQVAGETLLNWSEPLIRLVREHRILATAREDPIVSTNLDFTGASGLPYIEVDVPDDGNARHWIMTEAYWASSIEPPSVATVVDWLGSKQGATRAVDHLLGSKRGNVALRLMKRLFVAGLATILLVVYSLIRTVASIIPGAGLKETVFGPVDAFLTAWSGDMRTLLADPAQSMAVRDRIADVVDQLQSRGCGQIVILAHSGGAVASYLTLAERPELPVQKLVTFGEGLRIAFQLLDVEKFPPYPAGLLGRPIKSRLRPLRWFDYWASDDPVPAGALDEKTPGMRSRTSLPETSREIGNRWSFRQDHGTYWENDEEFSIPVLRHIDRPTTDGADSSYYTSAGARQSSEDRRYVRLGILGFWRSFVFAAAFAAVAIGSAGAAYHVYAAGAVEGSMANDGDLVSGLTDAWELYWRRFEDPDAGRTFRTPGGPLVDVGEAASQVWAKIPGTAILGGPVAYLRGPGSEHFVLAAAISVGLLLWPLVIVLGAFNVWPRERWAARWSGRGETLLRSMNLLISVPLLVGSLVGGLGMLALSIGTVGEPLVVGLLVLAVWWLVIGPLVGLLFRRRVIWRTYQLIGFIAMAFCLPLAAVANRGFGIVVVGSIITLAAFAGIGAVGEWRWRARDEHERRAVRTGHRLRFPMWWDASVGGLILGSVLFGVIAVAVGSFGMDPGVLLFGALACLIVGSLIGVQLDLYLNERTPPRVVTATSASSRPSSRG